MARKKNSTDHLTTAKSYMQLACLPSHPWGATCLDLSNHEWLGEKTQRDNAEIYSDLPLHTWLHHHHHSWEFPLHRFTVRPFMSSSFLPSPAYKGQVKHPTGNWRLAFVKWQREIDVLENNVSSIMNRYCNRTALRSQLYWGRVYTVVEISFQTPLTFSRMSNVSNFLFCFFPNQELGFT